VSARPPGGVRTLLRVLGFPLRRVLNPRVAWTVAEVDSRLGSRDNTRPPLHERLDRVDARMDALEVRLAHVAALVEDVRGQIGALAQTSEIERLATDEALAAVMEQLRLVELAVSEAAARRR